MSIEAVRALLTLRERGSSVWLGLMSGTSGDGIDAARVELEETSSGPKVVSIAGETIPFDPDLSVALRRVLESAGDFTAAARWDRLLGERFADAAARAIAHHGPVDAIALSGHTFSHRPSEASPATLQLGSPHCVSERTGRPVLFGFRAADLARGGEGAPLVPAGDRVLFGHLGNPIAVVNIGGISNVTWIARGEDPAAADAGPGNLLLDGVYRGCDAEGGQFDRDGALAETGTVDRATLARYIDSIPRDRFRRSYGREEFGAGWLSREHDQMTDQRTPDLLATLCAWISHEIARTIDELGVGRLPERVLVGGGGAHHRRLLTELSLAVRAPVERLREQEHGVDADLREAASFAILGHEWLYDRAGSFPGTTGVERAAPLGAWVFAPPSTFEVASTAPRT